MVDQTDQERAHGVHRLLRCRSRASEEGMNMGVSTVGHRLTIGDNGTERWEMPALLLGSARIEEGIKLRIEAGLCGHQIAQEKVINSRLMAKMPANTTTFGRWAPLHVGFR